MTTYFFLFDIQLQSSKGSSTALPLFGKRTVSMTPQAATFSIHGLRSWVRSGGEKRVDIVHGLRLHLRMDVFF